MEDIRYLQGYTNSESSMCADFNAAFDLIADIWVDGPTDAATKYLGIKNLLKEAHDKMDDINSEHPTSAYCEWCGTYGYGANGLIHDDSCILVRIRKVLE